MKTFKKIFYWIFAVLILTNLIIYITDTAYVYTAFRHLTAGIDDYPIFENRVVKNGKGVPWNIASSYNQTELPDFLLKDLTELQTIAFLVIQNDSIKYERYWDGYNENSITNSFSITKSIISILMGIAVDEGKIPGLDQKAGNYLEEFGEGKKAVITINHLLNMSSGLNWHEFYWSPVSYTTEAYYGTDLRKLIKKLQVETEPGTKFLYKSGDTQVLGFILQSATGMSISEYASEKLWKPIEAEHEALWSLDNKDGVEKSYCCFNSNARDFARIGKLYLNKGKWNDKQIVSGKYVNESLMPVMIKNKDNEEVDYYGKSWWLINHKGHHFYARGILGQYLIILPEDKIIIVRLGHKRDYTKIRNHPREVYTIIDGVKQSFTEK